MTLLQSPRSLHCDHHIEGPQSLLKYLHLLEISSTVKLKEQASLPEPRFVVERPYTDIFQLFQKQDIQCFVVFCLFVFSNYNLNLASTFKKTHYFHQKEISVHFNTFLNEPQRGHFSLLQTLFLSTLPLACFFLLFPLLLPTRKHLAHFCAKHRQA